MAAPKVSVVMPAYKSAGFIALAVNSVLAQTLQDWELIIVDDCSPDDTASVAMAAAGGDPRVKLVRAPQNGGVARARNLGNQQATGEWIAVLDSDDAYEPSRLETLLAQAEASGLDLIADDLLLVPFENIAAEGAPFLARPETTPQPVGLAAWLDGNKAESRAPILGYLKPMVRRDFLQRCNVSYHPDLKVAEDCWFVADLLACGARFAVLPRPLYRYAIRPASLSRSRGQNVFSMQRPVYAPFLARHGARLTDDDRRAVRRHENALRDAEAFEGFVLALRKRNLGAAIGWLAGRPQAARFLSKPVGVRFEKLARRFGYKPPMRVS